MKELNMRQIGAEFMPCLLIQGQRQQWLTQFSVLQEQTRYDLNFFPDVIPGDESWPNSFGPEIKNNKISSSKVQQKKMYLDV